MCHHGLKAVVWKGTRALDAQDAPHLKTSRTKFLMAIKNP